MFLMKLRVFSSLLLLFFAAYQLAAQAVSVGAAGALSFGVGSSLGVASVIVQESVPDAFRGRVMSFYGLSFAGVMPFAALAVARDCRCSRNASGASICRSGLLPVRHAIDASAPQNESRNALPRLYCGASGERPGARHR